MLDNNLIIWVTSMNRTYKNYSLLWWMKYNREYMNWAINMINMYIIFYFEIKHYYVNKNHTAREIKWSL